MNVKKSLYLFVALILTVGMSGCGPEQTMEEKTRDQVRENNKENLKLQQENLKETIQFQDEVVRQNIRNQEDMLYPLAGQYVGTLKKSGGGEIQALLDLTPIALIASSINLNEGASVPSLGGGLSVCGGMGTCLGLTNESELLLPVAQFNSAVYTPGKKRLVLHSAFVANNGAGSSGVTVQSYIDAFADGNVIEGNYGTTIKAHVGKLILKRRK